MGRPSFVKPCPVGTSRRGGVSFEHRVASGDPLARSVILWARVTAVRTPSSSSNRPKRVKVRYVVAADPRLQQVVERGDLFTGPERDYTIKVDADSVWPNGALNPGVIEVVAKTASGFSAIARQLHRLNPEFQSPPGHGCR